MDSVHTRHECPGEFDDPARRVVELAAARKGTPAPSLQPIPIIVMVAGGALDEGRIGGFERQHAMMCMGYSCPQRRTLTTILLEGGPCWVSPTPTPGQTSLVTLRSLGSHRLAHRSGRVCVAKKQSTTPIGKGTPKVKSENLSDDDSLQKQIRAAVKQALQVKQEVQGAQGYKDKRRRGKLRLVRDLDHEYPNCLRYRERRQSGWPMSFALIASSQILPATRSPQLVPVKMQGGVGSLCLSARAVVRAVTAEKHEPGLSPLYRVVSCDSAMEAWALLMRLLSHYQRARGVTFAVVPLLRAAWIRWLSVVIS